MRDLSMQQTAQTTEFSPGAQTLRDFEPGFISVKDHIRAFHLFYRLFLYTNVCWVSKTLLHIIFPAFSFADMLTSSAVACRKPVLFDFVRFHNTSTVDT